MFTPSPSFPRLLNPQIFLVLARNLLSRLMNLMQVCDAEDQVVGLSLVLSLILEGFNWAFHGFFCFPLKMQFLEWIKFWEYFCSLFFFTDFTVTVIKMSPYLKHWRRKHSTKVFFREAARKPGTQYFSFLAFDNSLLDLIPRKTFLCPASLSESAEAGLKEDRTHAHWLGTDFQGPWG